MMAVRMFIFLVAVLLYSLLIVGLQALVMNRDHSNLNHVPQDLNASVTTLYLEHNDIAVIYNGSLLRYRNLKELSLSFNPLEEIEHGTFDGHPELEVFKCYRCKLYRFPTDFGTASNSLKTIWFHWGIRNITAFNQMRLDRFTSLSRLTIRGVRGIDLDKIMFPSSLTHLGLGHMKLSTFPNLSLARFPKLCSANAVWNTFQKETTFSGVTEKISWIGFS